MIDKVIGGTSFGGTVGYVMKQDAQILDSEGITPPEVRYMVQDFADQSLLNPRLKNTVGHISLSFSEHDKAKLTDKKMTEIAHEYMQKMGITDTQFLIVRHHDAPHPHCHIVYNRVKNQNKLRPEDIAKIVSTHRKFTEGELPAGIVEDKYAYVATRTEITENDYNLNIPRYVDTYEEEEEVDIVAVQAEIDILETELAEVQSKMKEYLKELGY